MCVCGGGGGVNKSEGINSPMEVSVSVSYLLSDGASEVSVEDVLIFFSGAASIPPLRFDTEPALYFNPKSWYPTASTCAVTLTLPTKYHDNYADFRSNMTKALAWHGGFGLR